MRAGIASGADLLSGGFRLDASYHANEGSKAFSQLRRWAASDQASHRLDSVGSICLPGGIFIGGRAKRIYVDDPANGIPFLSSSDMLLASFDGVKLISRKQPELESLLLHPGWTLISRSGTIGNTAYVRRDMDNLAGSEHIMRVIADPKKIPSGYLYAYLSSPLGVRMIRQGTFGAVIDTIAPEYIASLPIPRLEPAQEVHIHQLIEQAAELRVQANQFKKRAEEKAVQVLGIDLQRSQSTKKIVVRSSNLNDRFEAAYHIAQDAIADLSDSTYPLVPLHKLLDNIFYLGKLHRVFVDSPQFGAPLLSISDVQKAKLSSEKFVSRILSRNINDALLQQGCILISRSGTPGIVAFVRREMVGMAGTDHLVRLFPNREKLLVGYLYTYLSSPLGNLSLTGSAHGSVQLMLPPEYIGLINIPLPPLELQKEIHDLIEQYGEALTQASGLEDQAQQILLENFMR